MKEVIFNYDNLTKKDIDEVVARAKALIINDKDEIILGYSNKTYQFPGGHLEKGENINECLIREIKEETGIEIYDYEITPFEKITYYNKNYHNTNKNRQNDIYFYILKTNKKINIENSSLDEGEKKGGYIAKIIPLKDVEQILIDSIKDNPINKVIVEEMLEVLKEYYKITTKKEQ